MDNAMWAFDGLYADEYMEGSRSLIQHPTNQIRRQWKMNKKQWIYISVIGILSWFWGFTTGYVLGIID